MLLLLMMMMMGLQLAGPAPSARADNGFGLDDVTERARALAGQPFREPEPAVPGWLRELDYDQWRDIRFRPERALWRESDARFQVQFFHPGLFYDRAVRIHSIDAQGVQSVPFSPGQYDYGRNAFASRVPQDLGHAGFRIHYPIRTPEYRDEVIVFLGASYLRAVGKEQGFGISARGLAIDTAEPLGEEFPFFREFWLVRPSPQAREMQVFALLDSRRATGAYHFVIRPGDATQVQVTARLFLRDPVAKLGIAPLTSMFLHGENSRRCVDDFRPEVHDSDGLMIAGADGEWLWRPLDNPERLQVYTFQARSPRGFGLLQRDRAFDHYQDLETRQERRPSVWIEPDGDWGAGHVELVEIPTPSDANDNIVAFWVPERRPAAGEALELGYRMSWYGSDPARPPGGRVTATRHDLAGSESVHRFVLDFAGGGLERIPASRVLRAVVSVEPQASAKAALIEQQLLKNPVDGSWRLVFQLRIEEEGPIEVRASLDEGGDALTETWTYTVQP